MQRRPRARIGRVRLQRVRGFRSATRSSFLYTPFGRQAPPDPWLCACAPESLPFPGLSSRPRTPASSLSLRTGTSRAPRPPGRRGLVGSPFRGRRLVACGRPRHSFNCWCKLLRGVSFSPGRRRACPEAGAWAPKLPPKSFGDRLESPWRRMSAQNPYWGCLASGIYLLSALALSSHFGVALVSAALVEFFFQVLD